MGGCWITQGAQPGALWWCWGGGWTGWMGRRGYMYTYVWLTLYGRNQHIVVMQLSSNLKKRIKKTLSLNLAVFWGTGEKGMVCTSTYEFLQGHNSAGKKWPMSPGWCLVLVNWFTWSSRQLRGYSFHLGPFLQACLSHSLAFQFTSFPLSLETPHRTSLSCWLWSVTGLWRDHCLYFLLFFLIH